MGRSRAARPRLASSVRPDRVSHARTRGRRPATRRDPRGAPPQMGSAGRRCATRTVPAAGHRRHRAARRDRSRAHRATDRTPRDVDGTHRPDHPARSRSSHHRAGHANMPSHPIQGEPSARTGDHEGSCTPAPAHRAADLRRRRLLPGRRIRVVGTVGLGGSGRGLAGACRLGWHVRLGRLLSSAPVATGSPSDTGSIAGPGAASLVRRGA